MNMNTLELTVSANELSCTRSVADDAMLTDAILTDAERQPCEVWTRVMGYHRPVSSFNTGKKAEHAERVFFSTGT
jgi:anaerobic ribonucleoside-triphosphate reductase